MNIGIDESGTFTYADNQGAWNCVAAFVFPETDKRRLSTLLDHFKISNGVSSATEIKLGQVDEGKYLNLLAELSRRGGTLHVVATDASLNPSEGIIKHKKAQAAKVVEHIDVMQYESMKTELRDLASCINGLSGQLYIQMQCQLFLALSILDTAVLYYVQRNPPTLGRFRWRIDQKNSTRTDYEDAYMKVLPAILQSASLSEPLVMLKGANYGAFSRFFYPRGEDPTYLRDVYGIRVEGTDEAKLNIGMIVKEDMQLVDSKCSLEVQLADLLVSGVRRCLRNESSNNDAMAAGLGKLMVQAPRNRTPISLVAFGTRGTKVSDDVARTIKIMQRNARAMLR